MCQGHFWPGAGRYHDVNAPSSGAFTPTTGSPTPPSTTYVALGFEIQVVQFA